MDDSFSDSFSLAVRLAYGACAIALVVGTFGAIGAFYWAMAKRWTQGKNAYDNYRASLCRLGFQDVGKERLCGPMGNLTVTINSRVVHTQAAEIELEGLPVVAIATPFSQTRFITSISAPLQAPLPSRLTLTHVDSGHPPLPLPSSQPVPGHAHGLPDAVHRVQATDVRQAAAFLDGFARRGGVADIEAGGWRVSFDSERAYVERKGMPLPMAELRGGAARLERLIGRLLEV